MRHLFLLLLGAPNLLLLLLLFCIAADTVAKSPGAQDDVRPPLSSSDAAARAGIIVLKIDSFTAVVISMPSPSSYCSSDGIAFSFIYAPAYCSS